MRKAINALSEISEKDAHVALVAYDKIIHAFSQYGIDGVVKDFEILLDSESKGELSAPNSVIRILTNVYLFALMALHKDPIEICIHNETNKVTIKKVTTPNF